MRVYDRTTGERIACTARYWLGQDAQYLVLVIKREDGLPPDIFEDVYVVEFDQQKIFRVREIEHDMAKDEFVCQAIDLESFERRFKKHVPKPPRFRSQEEADAWMEAHG